MTQQDLQSGDLLLCKGWEVVRRVTSSDVGHVELYLGNGVTISSHTDKGVNYFPLDLNELELVHVLRPEGIFNHEELVKRMAQYIGRPYGWADCVNDIGFELGNRSDSMNCSHTCALALRCAGIDVIADYFDISKVKPSDLMMLKGFKKLL